MNNPYTIQSKKGGDRPQTRNGALKMRARTTLLGHWGDHTVFSLALIGLELLAGTLSGMITGTGLKANLMSFGISAILQLLLGLFYDGALWHFLKCLRGEASPIKDLLMPLTVQPDRYLIVGMAKLLGAVVIYLPLYFAAFLLVPAGRARLIFVLFAALAGSLLYLFFLSAIAMSVFFLMENPEMSAALAMKESIRVMRGGKLRFMRFILSFFGVALLGVLSLGIGFVWGLPYLLMGVAAFYEDLMRKEEL